MADGLELPYGIKPVNATLVDVYAGPYTSVSAANTAIPSSLRVQTRFVHIIIDGVGKLYWYKNGITDDNLVEFKSNSDSGSTDTSVSKKGKTTISGDYLDILFDEAFADGTEYIIFPYCYSDAGNVNCVISNQTLSGFRVTPAEPCTFIYRTETL
jgi:hypothetical protein